MNPEIKILRVTIWTLIVIGVLVSLDSYLVYQEFARPDYNTNDSGFVQGVAIGYFIFGLCGLITAFLIPLIATKLQSKNKLKFSLFFLTTVAVAIMLIIVLMTYPLQSFIGTGSAESYWFTIYLLGVLALISSIFCSLLWWVVGRILSLKDRSL